MNKKEEPVDERNVDPQEDLVRRLLKLSGGRPAVSEDITSRVRESVRSEWQRNLRASKRNRLFVLIGLPLAACLLLFIVSWNLRKTYFVPGNVAVIEAHLGDIKLNSENVRSAGSTVLAQSTLESGNNGRALLRMPNGITIRMDVLTRVRLESESLLVLERGAVYLDSGTAHSKILVDTPLGDVANHGTQYEIRLQPRAMEVRVRQGSVSLKKDSISQEITAGNRLSIDSDGRISLSEFATYGPEWDWVAQVAPVFRLEGRTLSEFLTWVANENGWTLSGSDVQRSYGNIILHGSVENLTPAQMLEAVVPVCGLSYRLNEGVLTIELPGKRLS